MDFKNLQDDEIYEVTLDMPGEFVKQVLALAKTPEDTVATIIQNALGLYRTAKGMTDKKGNLTVQKDGHVYTIKNI